VKRALLAGALAPGALAALLLTSADAAPRPEPERGVAVVLEPTAGRVYVRRDGISRYRRLLTSERLPVGTTVDAQEGGVRLVVASDDDGGTSRAVFSEGKFTVTQPRTGDPVTTLELTGPSLRDTCGTASAAGRKRKRVRRLWGDGHGSFRTAGHYSAATVRGTRWLTEDRCDGTVTRVVRGTVAVEDFTIPPPPPPPPERSPEQPAAAPEPATGAPDDASGVLVPAGKSYVARPGD
jgi:hypothetical protein